MLVILKQRIAPACALIATCALVAPGCAPDNYYLVNQSAILRLDEVPKTMRDEAAVPAIRVADNKPVFIRGEALQSAPRRSRDPQQLVKVSSVGGLQRTGLPVQLGSVFGGLLGALIIGVARDTSGDNSAILGAGYFFTYSAAVNLSVGAVLTAVGATVHPLEVAPPPGIPFDTVPAPTHDSALHFDF